MHHGIVDMHTHIIPECYRAALTEAGRIMEDGFPCPPWSAQQHIAFMDEMGIDISVLSISSPHHMHDLTDYEVALTRQINDEMAAISRENDRFRFAACLPLPMVEESVAEACRALDELGAVAVKLPTNACGVYPADARFAPLMDVLNRRNAVVLFHPCKPAAVPEGCFTAGPLPLFEFLGDTTRAVIDLIANNVPARWPNIRFIWTVRVGLATLRTDAIGFMPWKHGHRGGNPLRDKDCAELKYCIDLICLDLGHMKVSDISFLQYMPKMKYLIVGELPCPDFTPIRYCKELIYLEIFNVTFQHQDRVRLQIIHKFRF